MHRVFISDLHLEHVGDPSTQCFGECLRVESRRADEIYLLGDIVEMWIGDDDNSELAQWLYTALTAASDHAKLYLVHGNRDFLMGQAFATRSRVTMLTDPSPITGGVLVAHGDALCTDDVAYQAMRKTLRSAEWQSDILSKSLEERKAFGKALREQSRAANANKAANIMDVNAGAVGELMASHEATVLVHGHTHRPGIHAIDGKTRIVLGAWERCGWLARQVDDAVQLECFCVTQPYG